VSDHLPTKPRLSLLFRLLHQHYAQAVQSALAEQGFGDITTAQAQLLPFLPPEGTSVARLTERVVLRKQSVTELVLQLERAGYVERRPNPTDGRSQLVYLTARGQAAVPVAVEAGDLVEAEWASLTSWSTIESVRKALRAVLIGVEAQR
jgi:DNA-binding MarR family transcriptional regulator